MHETKSDSLSSDRLGMRLYLVNKDESNSTLSVEDMNEIFNNYRPNIEKQIKEKLDNEGKGYTDLENLITTVKEQIQDEYM